MWQDSVVTVPVWPPLAKYVWFVSVTWHGVPPGAMLKTSLVVVSAPSSCTPMLPGLHAWAAALKQVSAPGSWLSNSPEALVPIQPQLACGRALCV
jgi:hypothetical protein